MFTQKNVLRMFIGKSVAQTTNATLIDAYTDLADGAIAVVDMTNTVATDISALTFVRFVTRQGTQLFYSPQIRVSDIKQSLTQGYNAAVEQVTYVGSNGTSGALEKANSVLYLMKIILQDTFTTFGNKSMYKYGEYKSDASAAQDEIANGLFNSLLANFEGEPEELIAFGVINSNAGTAMGAADDTVVGVKGTKTVTVVEGTGPTTAVVAGDYVRIGLLTTDPVYKVYASTVADAGGIITLYEPLQESFSLLGTTSEMIASADAIAADFGIKLTGVARTNFAPGTFKYMKSRFKVQFVVDDSGSGSTQIEYTTGAEEGSNTYEQVATLEWWANGNEQSNGVRTVYPGDPALRAVADSTKTYETIALGSIDSEFTHVIGYSPASLQELLLTFEKDSAQGDAMITTLNTAANISLSAFPA